MATGPKSFWGLIIKPEKRYEQIVEESFHVSKACLDLQTAGNGVTSLYIEVEDQPEEYLISHLQSKNFSDNLDLNFQAGEKICFRAAGQGTVHLSGYLIDEDMDMDTEMMMDSDMDEEESDEEVPSLVNGNPQKKRKISGEEAAKDAKKSKLDKALAEKKKKGLDLKAPETDEEVKDAIKKAEAMQKKIAQTVQKKKKNVDDDEEDEDSDENDDSEEEDEDEEEEEEEEEEESDEDEAEEEEESEDEDEDEEMEVSPSKKTGKKKEALSNGVTPKKDQKMKGGDNAGTPAAKKTDTPKSSKKDKNKNADKPETPAKKGTETPQKKGAETPQSQKKQPKTPKRTLKGGIIVEDLVQGTGPEVKRNKMIGMFYEGRLASNNKTFDAKKSGEPFKFRLGQGEVIKGWDIGLEGMKVGGKRKLTIPPKMAYGSEKLSGIPPNSTLVFDVECKFVS